MTESNGVTYSVKDLLHEINDKVDSINQKLDNLDTRLTVVETRQASRFEGWKLWVPIVTYPVVVVVGSLALHVLVN